MIRHTKGPGSHGFLKGGHRPSEYRVWTGVIQRCYNPRCREFPWYGGRGIGVCGRWLEANGFAHFFTDVGPQPFRRASLHRLDNDGDYHPGNVVWTTARTQSRHRRSNHVLHHDGLSLILADWALRVGMKPSTLAARLRSGWPVGKALTRPVETRRPYAEWARHNPNPRKRGRKPKGGGRSETTTSPDNKAEEVP
jgi:hypothetical protein